MAKYKPESSKVISFVLMIAFALFVVVIGYATYKGGSFELRSKAAQEDYVVKRWEFDGAENDWVGSGITLEVKDGMLKTKVTDPNTAKIAVGGAAATLTKGKKKIQLVLAVMSPNGGAYKFHLRYKTRNGTNWSSWLPVKGVADGTAQTYSVTLANTLSTIIMDKIELKFSGMPKDATVNIDSIRIISTKAAGTITRDGRLDAGSKLTVSPRETYQLVAGQGVNFSSYVGKFVRVTGKLSYTGSDYKTPTVTVTKIENAKEEVVIKEWGFTDNGEWSASNAKLFAVEDGNLELTVGSDGTADIINNAVNLSLPSGSKKITFDAAVTLPEDHAPVFALKVVLQGSDWTGKKVVVTPDGNEHTYEVPLPDAAKGLKEIRFRAVGIHEDAIISIGSMKVSVEKASGTITKVGKLTKDGDAYTLTVTNKEKYRVIAGGSINLATYEDTYVRLTGTLGWSADGKTPILTAAQIEAAEEEVPAMEWLFNGVDPYDTEGWNAENLASYYVLGGTLRAKAGSVVNPRVVNSEVNLPIANGKKRTEIVMTVSGDLAVNPNFTLLMMPSGSSGWKKYVFPVNGDGAEHTYSIVLPTEKVRYAKAAIEFTGAKSGARISINSIRILATKPAGTIIKTGDLTKEQDDYVLTVKTRINKDKVKTDKYSLIVPTDSTINLEEYVGRNVDVNGRLDNTVTKKYTVISVVTIE